MNKLAAIVLLVAFSAPAIANLNSSELAEATKAAKEGDSEKLSALLAPHSKDKGSYQFTCLLSEALPFTGMELSRDNCKKTADIIEVLIGYGAKPTEKTKNEDHQNWALGHLGESQGCEHSGDLSNAILYNCPEVVEKLAPHMASSDVAIGTNKIVWKIPRSSFNGNSSGPNKKQELSDADQNTLKIMSTLTKSLTPNCPKETSSCEAIKKIAATKADYDLRMSKIAADEQTEKDRSAQQETTRKLAEQKAIDEENSPQAIQKLACDAVGNIKQAEKLMKTENDVGRESGYVNKASLHELGQMKVYAKQDLEKRKQAYKKRTGKQLDTSRCKSDQN